MSPETGTARGLPDALGRLLFVLALAAGLAWLLRDSLVATRERNLSMAEELRRTRLLLEMLSIEREALTREIDALQGDPFYVELLLRRRYGFRRPGEIVLSDPIPAAGTPGPLPEAASIR
ncbi:MAG: septum formation initiator family protein [Planctomycetes bacterium]|nr:septum formation initiator family protein [Planctomycetota bacterium]